MTCRYCEEDVTVVNGKLCSGESTVLNHVMDGGESVFTFPPDPHCYWSPTGKHVDSSSCFECDGTGFTRQGWTDKNGYSEDQYGPCRECSA